MGFLQCLGPTLPWGCPEASLAGASRLKSPAQPRLLPGLLFPASSRTGAVRRRLTAWVPPSLAWLLYERRSADCGCDWLVLSGLLGEPMICLQCIDISIPRWRAFLGCPMSRSTQPSVPGILWSQASIRFCAFGHKQGLPQPSPGSRGRSKPWSGE